MNFSIRDILVATTAVALTLALARLALGYFVVVFLVAHLALLFGPVAVLITTIVFADQRGGYLDIKTNPFYHLLKKLWLLAALSAMVVWILLLAGVIL